MKYAENRKKQLDRDLKILWLLSSGPVSTNRIRDELFIHNGKKLSRQCVERRINKLVQMGYVVKQQYKVSRKVLTVVALDELGQNEVTNNFSIAREHIRVGLPNQLKLLHELMLSAIMSILRKEGESKYKLIALHDDSVLKRQTPPSQRRGGYLPDLVLEMTRPSNGRIVIYVELDTGNKSKSYWQPKIKSWNEVALVLCLNAQRLARMKWYVQHSGRKVPTGFALAHDFIKNGLAQTVFDWLPGNTRAKFDLN
jgi:DNA-binding PadR family transcriptional regulator